MKNETKHLLVVEDDKGNRVAIQCDGDRAQTMEAVAEELARQQMLRRLGWDKTVSPAERALVDLLKSEAPGFAQGLQEATKSIEAA